MNFEVKMSDSYLEVSIEITPVGLSESQDNNFVCRQCGQCFVSKSELETHESSHPAYKLHRCEHCSMCFRKEEKLKEHTQKKHGVPGAFTDLTAESSNSEAICKNVGEVKMSDAHDVQYYRCGQCAKGFVSKSELEMHQSSHPVEKLLRCKDCGMYFQEEEKLHKHALEKHGVLLQESSELSKNSPGINPLECGQDDGSTVEQYSCGLCGQKYVSKSELEMHQSSHPIEKLLRCKYCGMYFQKEEKLQQHAQEKHGVVLPKSLFPVDKIVEAPSNSNTGRKKIGKTKKQPVRSECLTSNKNGGNFIQKKASKCTQSGEHLSDPEDDETITGMHSHSQEVVPHILSEHSHCVQVSQHAESATVEQYSCGLCGQKYVSKSELEKHVCSELPEKLLRCKDCGMYFRMEAKLQRHAQKKHGVQGPLLPVKINQPTYNKAGSKKRPKTKKQAARYECTHCGKYFNSQNRFQQHKRKQHTGELPFQCSYCSKSFRIQSQRSAHERSHTGEKPFSCYHCSKSFQTVTLLRYHEQSHNNSDKRYKCSYCDSSFAIPSQLKLHERRHTGEKPFKCMYCDKCFSSKSSLRDHQQTHAEVPKPYNCTHCDKTFVSMSVLKEHKRYHTGERPHKCSKCDRSFLSKSDLARHERLPHDKNRFVEVYRTQLRGYRDTKCTQCDKVFKHPYQLRRHQVIHSTERNFKCELCSYSSKYHNALKRHIIRKHEQDKPIECTICKKVLKNSLSLSDHKRRVHDPEKSQEKLNEHVQIMHGVRDSFIATNSAGINPLDSSHNFGIISNDASLIFAEQSHDNKLDPSGECSSSAQESEDSDSETADHDMMESAVGLQMEVFVLEDATVFELANDT